MSPLHLKTDRGLKSLNLGVVPAEEPEIIPVEPDPDNAGEGIQDFFSRSSLLSNPQYPPLEKNG